ncbi:hypothetical protein L204_100728 [Cryptococcus depauperatus]
MSSKPIAAVRGIAAYARFSSVPSLLGSMGIASVMMLSCMRIRDGMDWGYETAAASSATFMYPTIRRSIKTRAPIPVTLALLATASTVYYLRESFDDHAEHKAVSL